MGIKYLFESLTEINSTAGKPKNVTHQVFYFLYTNHNSKINDINRVIDDLGDRFQWQIHIYDFFFFKKESSLHSLLSFQSISVLWLGLSNVAYGSSTK